MPPPPPPPASTYVPQSVPAPLRKGRGLTFEDEFGNSSDEDTGAASRVRSDPQQVLQGLVHSIFTDCTTALRKLQSSSDYEIVQYNNSVQDAIDNEEGLNPEAHNRLMREKLIVSQRRLENIVTKQSSDSKALLLSATQDYKAAATKCFSSAAREVKEMRELLDSAIQGEQMAREQCRVLQERFDERLEEHKVQVDQKSAGVIARCEQMVKDAQNAAAAERKASQLMTMETKRYEVEARAEWENSVRDHYEGMIQHLAAENSRCKRSMRKAEDKFAMYVAG